MPFNRLNSESFQDEVCVKNVSIVQNYRKKFSRNQPSLLLITLDQHPHEDLIGRASMVNALIDSYGLRELMTVTPSKPANIEDLSKFHSSNYVNFLVRAGQAKNSAALEDLEDEGEDFGIAYDCPLFFQIKKFCEVIAGSSLTAASCLVENIADICINWCGGWHHAQREEASGFCYVNDIVLAIQRLLEHFHHVLYIDIDVHHGNGVEDAFSSTKRVLTLSIHKRGPGFYPGGGEVATSSKHAINVPLQDGLTDKSFVEVFQRVTDGARKVFAADALVLQCGADGLAGDKLGGFNLTSRGYVDCVKIALGWNLPTLVLGGGGYKKMNVARCWTEITAAILGVELSPDIPERCIDFEWFGPSFELAVDRGNQRDLNTPAAIKLVLAAVDERLEQLASE